MMPRTALVGRRRRSLPYGIPPRCRPTASPERLALLRGSGTGGTRGRDPAHERRRQNEVGHIDAAAPSRAAAIPAGVGRVRSPVRGDSCPDGPIDREVRCNRPPRTGPAKRLLRVDLPRAAGYYGRGDGGAAAFLHYVRIKIGSRPALLRSAFGSAKGRSLDAGSPHLPTTHASSAEPAARSRPS